MRAYLTQLTLPSEGTEFAFLDRQKLNLGLSPYPFKLFPMRELQTIDLSPITILYGGNGSGKSTLLNVLAEKAGVIRHSPFNSGDFFPAYVDMCMLRGSAPPGSRILTSDDVFDYLLHSRSLTNGMLDRKDALLAEYQDYRSSGLRFTGMADYDRWKEGYDAKVKTASQFIRERLSVAPQLRSNGESAVNFFAEHIRENAVYILDEPENSLSVHLQKELASFLYSSARGANCQLIIATHSPVLLALEGAQVYDLDSYPVRIRPWTELENVRSWYAFFREHAAELEREIDEAPYRFDSPEYAELANLLQSRGLTPKNAIDFCDIVPDGETLARITEYVRGRTGNVTNRELFACLAKLRRAGRESWMNGAE